MSELANEAYRKILYYLGEAKADEVATDVRNGEMTADEAIQEITNGDLSAGGDIELVPRSAHNFGYSEDGQYFLTYDQYTGAFDVWEVA